MQVKPVVKADVKKFFGAAVRLRRDNLGISQEELAGRAGLHRTYISDVERGARNVSLESIHRLASALQVPVSVLFEWQQENSTPNNNHTPLVSPDELVEILIIEESEEDAELTIKALRELGLTNRIHVVHNGQSALDFLFAKGDYANRKHTERPQLILLDLRLPRVDGVEVLRQIKSDPRTRTIPLIVLAGSNKDRDVTATQQLAADAYIVKPVDFHNLSGATRQLRLQWALLKRPPKLNV